MAQTLRFGLQLVYTDPFWVMVREPIFKKAAQVGADLIPLELDLSSLSGEEQMGLMEGLLAQELNALIMQDLNPDLIRQIADSGMPIIMGGEIEISHPLVAVATGLIGAARMGTRYLAEQLKGEGHLLIAGGLTESYDAGQKRLQGIHETLKDYPGIEVTHAPASWRYDLAFDQISDTMQRLERPFHAIFGLSDTLALAARDAGKDIGMVDERTVIVGINGDPLALAAIIDGSISATVETNAFEFGSTMFDLALRVTQGQPLPRTFSHNPRLITGENMAETATRNLVAMANLPSRLVGISRRQREERLTQMETSLEISRRVGSILDWQELRRETAELIRTNYSYDDVQIFLWSDSRREFILDASGESHGEAVPIPLDESGLLGYTLLNNQPTFIPDARHSPRFPPDPDWPATRSRVILPVRRGSQILGLLDLHSRKPTHHTHQTLIGLQTLADQLGIGAQNAQLYSEAVDARAEAERANQLRGRLLANVSHGLRTPLNVILGYSQSALDNPDLYGTDLPPDLIRDLRYIYNSGQHLERLISDLLDLSRAEIGALDLFTERIEPRAWLEEVFQSTAGSLSTGSDMEWRLELPETLPPITADPPRLRQVILNLLSNARKFTASGHITLGAQATPVHLHIWVRDTGQGIEPQQRQQIFDAFTTGDQSLQPGHGLGLGLRIVHEVIKLHGGAVWIESSPGAGSTFHIQLPLDSTDAISEEPPASVRPPARPPLPDDFDDLPPNLGQLTRQVVQRIGRDFDQALSRRQLAEEMGVTENYLSRVFRKELGLTPWQYLTRCRISSARHLLCTSSLTITEIANRVGYNDAAYFSRVFRRETGQAPRAFRSNAGQSG
ncbi:MAG: ATP-binding protein [Chloroflexota bacterium]|nr:ATP-binding protein [Chloroflexota bacterium]